MKNYRDKKRCNYSKILRKFKSTSARNSKIVDGVARKLFDQENK